MQKVRVVSNEKVVFYEQKLKQKNGGNDTSYTRNFKFACLDFVNGI